MSSINMSGNMTGAMAGIAPLKAGQLAGAGTTGAAGTTSFKDMLIDSIREVNTMQQNADVAVENLATGGDVNPAEVLTAVQKADLAFRMMMQVRNKLVAAYQEIKDVRV